MPVQTCTLDGKPGYRWGDSGKCYTYAAGNEPARKQAKRKAYIQGVAIGEKSTQTRGVVFQPDETYANMDAMSNPTPIQLHEVASAKVDVSGIIKDPEVLRERGLNPDHYIALVPAELGKAGQVTKNDRLYIPEEFTGQHELLEGRLKHEFVDSEENHPNMLQGPGFRIPARLVHVETYVDEQGVTRSRGEFAMMNTTAGKDMLVYIEAGLPVGTSSRGRGIAERHVLDEKSPYLELNREHEGKTVTLIRNFELDRTPYDFVRDPSAATFVAGGNPHLEAIREMVSEQILTFFGMEDTMPDPKNPPEVSGFTQEQLDAAVEEAKASVLGDARIVAALALAEQINPDNKPVEEIVASLEAVETKADELAEKLEAAQAKAVAERTSLEERLDSLNEQVGQLVAARDALQKAQALAEAVDKACETSTRPKAMREYLEGLQEDGLLADSEKVAAQAARFESTLEKAMSTAAPEAKVEAADKDVDSPAPAKVVATENTNPGHVTVDALRQAVAAVRR
jgi:hypothetical protein